MRYILSIFLPGIIAGGISLAWALSLGLWIPIILMWLLISGLGIATGFHRIYSHRTHNLRPWLDNIILFLGTLGGQGSSISWVAIHRGYHHKHSDGDKDLHSPKHGLFHAFAGWYWTTDLINLSYRSAIDLLRKPNHVFFHRHYTKIVYSSCLIMGLISWKLLLCYLSALCISLIQDNCVNVFCHYSKIGYRNYEIRDTSVNFWPLGYFGWGQGWHNNHHANPSSFNFGKKWWEFDPCIIFLPILTLGSN